MISCWYFWMFLKELSYTHQDCIILIKNAVKFWNIIIILNNCSVF